MIPKIIYEDDWLLILDKPPGLVVDKSETQTEGTLEDMLVLDSRFHPKGTSHFVMARGNDKLLRSGIVHRLDKDTSGLILVAKLKNSLVNLQNQFKSREVKKEYLALVHGLIEKSGRVEGDIGRNPGDRLKFTVLREEGGKNAVTEYEPIKRLEISEKYLVKIFEGFNKIQMRKLSNTHYGLYTLVRCFPKTGRTHQIRVHLKYVGHPIVADEKYAGRKMYRLDHRWVDRQFLHAAKIGFVHPSSGKWMEFESKLPQDLEKALSYLLSRT